MSTAFIIGLALGLRHSVDPDHLVAVTSMLSDGRRARAALGIGLWWSIGHATAMLGVGTLILATGWSFSQRWQSGLEAMVGVTIVLLGSIVLRNHGKGRVHWHEHAHAHAEHAHFHRHSYGDEGHVGAHVHDHTGPGRLRALAVGAIHGLAGSGPVVILLALTFPTLTQRYAALIASAAGTLCGMVVATGCLALPFVGSSSLDSRWTARLQVATGAAGVVFGVGFIFRALGSF